jgi:hypothetical protein
MPLTESHRSTAESQNGRKCAATHYRYYVFRLGLCRGGRSRLCSARTKVVMRVSWHASWWVCAQRPGSQACFGPDATGERVSVRPTLQWDYR